ncbi:putative guanine deaminase [Cytospora mali]|uniref:Guanine deaminase n=1 Tax=Cytospora mali TaxID=578113 RepID=A0A194VK11_CYTMA|nr:putative guanine deaminase [Valsa mali]
MDKPLLFHGSVIHSLSPTELEIVESALLVVDGHGRIIAFNKDITSIPEKLELPDHPNILVADCHIRTLQRGTFLIPGFVDTHNHAPQWAQRGLGQGMHILDWLDGVTFPNEAKFSDPEYARMVYSRCIDGFLKQGVTTASYYGSAHGEATRILADICLEKGQRALVGKCNMNRNAPDYYRDTTVDESLRVTEECIQHIRDIDPESHLLKPVLTPRFAITCEPSLLQGLGRIAAREPEIPIQTHFNEAEQEMQATKSLFPDFDSEVDLYHHYGLLGSRSILAHCCYMSEYELQRLSDLDCGVAHCPISNMTVGGGFMAAPVRKFLHHGINVGLGTDSGGGFSSSILDAMRQALVASNAREAMSMGDDKGLSVEELFYLATLGGARVCSLADKVGNFAVGKEFDSCVISTVVDDQIMTMIEPGDSLRIVFEKFVMTGDDRNITDVYVRGRRVK